MKKFLVSKNHTERVDFIKKIKGKKVCIYREETELNKLFDLALSYKELQKDDYYLTNLGKIDQNYTLVWIDILDRNGGYGKMDGRIYNFCNQAKETFVIDTFAFKYNERQIIRPFIAINPDLLGEIIDHFMMGENTVETYAEIIKPYISITTPPIEIEVVNYKPTQVEIGLYNAVKEDLIMKQNLPKTKVINALIKFVDELQSKRDAMGKITGNTVAVLSNKPSNKFWLYDTLKNENLKKVTFFSSGIFGADEIELQKTKTAIERHNELIRLING